MRRYLAFALACAPVFAQTAATAKADNCAPPPGSVPPPLPAKLLEGQGTIAFLKITTKSAEAQKFFNQGVAQMHSFWAREAERSFLQAAALDPEAPMPHWGIAMVAAGDYRPGFQLDLVNGSPAKIRPRTGQPRGGEARAIAAAKKAAELAAIAGRASDLEKAYIATTSARRDLSLRDPNGAYVRALRDLIAKHPKEVEARTYLALQIMSGFVLPDKRPRAGSSESAEILRQLLKDAPDHAGVHHYVIHGFEGSTFAKDAWPSCERYGAIANNIPHGLHMPGHIWAQTGRWTEAVKSFGDAASNEVYWMKQDSLGGNGHHGHNVHFLATSYSFSGDFDKAMEAARGLLEYKETPREQKAPDTYRSAWRQGWFSVLRTLVQHEKWDLILDGKSLPEGGKPRENAWRSWAVALAKLNKGDRDGASAEAKSMDRALAAYKSATKARVPESLLVARAELKAHLEASASKRMRLLEQASRQERALLYNEPPLYPRPVAEALGAFALSQGKHQEAEKAYRVALDQYPEDAHAKRGLRAALERQSKAVEAGGGGR